MKKIFTLICFIALYNIFVYSQSGWKWQTPSPQGNNLKSVYFTDVNIGYAVGDAGTILKTTNAGISWELIISGTTSDLKSIYFTDSNIGYALGTYYDSGYSYGIILKTINAGANWYVIASAQSMLYSIFFTDANTGYAVGYQGAIRKTIDAGVTWTICPSGTMWNLNSVCFTDANTGYAVGNYGTIIKTTNAGSTWTAQTSGTTQILNSVYFTDINTGYVGGDATILKTSNTGNNWTTQINENYYNIKSVYFTDVNTGYSVGQYGLILKTTNAGITWLEQSYGTVLNSVYFTDINTGYAVGDAGAIYKTTNTGSTWIEQSEGISNALSSVYFTDTLTGYSVGKNGTILKTINNGTDWTAQMSGTSDELRSVYFIDIYMGFIVGVNGTILKTTNAGNTWTAQTSGTNSELNSVYFTDANSGYIVGNNGTILKTSDGGINWNLQSSGTSIDLKSIYFTDVNTGYTVGYNGIILKTSNAGTDWIVQPSGTILNLHSIYFTDANTGYVVGRHGTILKTTNAGTNWATQTNSIVKNLYSVYFTDANTGYAIGYSGSIYKTIDAGAYWAPKTSGTYYLLSSVYFINANIGFAAGGCGTILKTIDAGVNWTTQSGGTNNWLVSVYFPNTNNGYAVGNNRTIFKTTNAGVEWRTKTSGVSAGLTSVFFPDFSNGFIVGWNGTILKTTNTGTDWTIQPSGTTKALYSVYFTNVNTGYAVGEYGTLIKTSNGGINWTLLSSGTTADLWSVYFTDANTGYAVGGETIFKTTNGGTNWTTQTSGSTQGLLSIYFTDANTGYAVGGNGTIIKTTNAGNDWIPKTSGTTYYLRSVYFTDANIGYAVGQSGTILKTINAGTSWTTLPSGTINGLSSIYFTDINNGYIVGDFGTILKTYTGGEYVSATIDSLQIMNIQNVSNSNNCSLPYNSNLFINTLVSGSSYHFEDSLIYHFWFGDGADTTFTKTIQNIPSYISNYLQHTYTFTGLYSVTCKVTAPDGRTDSLSLNNFIIVSDTCGNISGTVFKDENSNCIKDTGELSISNQKISLFHNNQFFALTYSNSNGFYSFNVPDITEYTVKIDTISLFGLTPLCPDSASYYINQFPAINKDFVLQCNMGYDLDAFLTGTNFRPGITGYLNLDIKNHSCNPYNGAVSVKLDSMVSFQNSSPMPDTIIGNNIIWYFNNLTNQQNINIPISVLTNIQAWIGTQLCFDINLFPIQGDSDTLNNIHHYCFPIINSWDPNFKEVKPATLNNFNAVNGALEYTIHFQNTGNAEAFNIFILDTLDSNLDISTFQIISYSHPMNIQVSCDSLHTILKFIFSNIMLPDSANNEMLSHGYVSYTINVKSNLLTDTKIINTAHIFFDYNPAIVTNTTESVVPEPPVVLSSINYCINSTALPLTAVGNNLLWYLTPVSTGMTNSPTPTTTEYGSVIYYVSQTISGLESPKAEIIVNIVHPDTLFQTFSVCDIDSILINNKWRSANGIYIDTLQTNLGCDSIILSNLQFNIYYNTSVSTSICEGQNYFFNNHTYSAFGIYYDTLHTTYGCDSIVITNLSVSPVYTSYNPIAICQGENYIFNEHTYVTDGIYNDTLQAINGCDSLIITNLIVNSAHTSNNPITICQGQSYIFNGHSYATTGIYNDTLFTINSCDSIIVTNLSVSSVYISNNPITICQGQSYILNGHIYSTVGFYNDTLNSINSCDSIIITNLTVNALPNAGLNVIDTTCSFDSQFNLFSSLQGNPDLGGTWNDDDNTGALIDSIFNPSIVNTGIYHFTYTVFGTPPCNDAQSNVSVVVDICERINEINNSGIYIYPNPTNGKIYIKSENIIQVKVFNIIGEQIYVGNTNTCNVISLKQKGVYLFELSTDKNRIYKKVVVQ